MDRIVRDANGVPILSREDIEVIAEKTLLAFCPECLSAPRFTPMAEVYRLVKEHYDVDYSFDVDLGCDPQGRKYLGRFHIEKRVIYIDPSISDADPRFSFTLAHELAHYALHRDIGRVAPQLIDDGEISDTESDLQLDRLSTDNPRTWMEWQANKFAASLLLPRRTLPAVVRALLMEKDTPHPDQIYLDNQRCNITNYLEIVQRLMEIYLVSKSTITLRLKELNLLVDESNLTGDGGATGPRSVADILGDIFRN